MRCMQRFIQFGSVGVSVQYYFIIIFFFQRNFIFYLLFSIHQAWLILIIFPCFPYNDLSIFILHYIHYILKLYTNGFYSHCLYICV